MNELQAGWAKQELLLPTRYPLAGYIARKGVSHGTNDPLFVRVLVLQHGDVRIVVLVADLLLISTSWASRLQKKIARAIRSPIRNIIVAATHTHSGPLVDTAPFRLTNQAASKRTQRLMRTLEKQFVQTVTTALDSLRAVAVSYTRCPIRNLATDRNNPEKNLVQPFFLARLDAKGSSAILGVMPCHPTIFGANNRYYSGDLQGEIARRYERQVDVALIANGATANISTRFTRRSQTQAQVSRFATLVMSQIRSRPFQPCAPCELSLSSRTVRLPIRDFQQHSINPVERSGRLAEVASEAAQVALQLSRMREFHGKNVPVTVTLMRLGPISFAALPVEMYGETGAFLWSSARTIPLCYANGYWGYVFASGANEADYEVISSPFDSRADKLLRAAVVSFANKLRSSGKSK